MNRAQAATGSRAASGIPPPPANIIEHNSDDEEDGFNGDDGENNENYDPALQKHSAAGPDVCFAFYS